MISGGDTSTVRRKLMGNFSYNCVPILLYWLQYVISERSLVIVSVASEFQYSVFHFNFSAQYCSRISEHAMHVLSYSPTSKRYCLRNGKPYRHRHYKNFKNNNEMKMAYCIILSNTYLTLTVSILPKFTEKYTE